MCMKNHSEHLKLATIDVLLYSPTGHTILMQKIIMEKKKKKIGLNLQEQAMEKTNDAMPKHIQELINEISKLELEVSYMEKYLLALYRKTFEKRIPFADEEGNSIRRCQSSLSHRSISRQISYQRPGEASHSLPLSMLERSRFPSSTTLSLGEYLDMDANSSELETPNWVSEELIKSISEIYCELADPPVTNHHFPSSTQIGFLSFNSNLDENCRDGVVRYRSSMVEVESISTDAERMKSVGYMLRKFRSLVHRLRQVDPRKMKREEKIAFWINVHNALGMHAFLVHGVPRNKFKRLSILLKASFNIGGHPISLEMIQNDILHCKLLHSGQWLRLLFLSRHTLNARKSYAIPDPEPLLHFALCCGYRSDAAVRVYRPTSVFEELQAAKEEHVQSNLRVQKGKIFLPRLVGNYLKLSGSTPRDLLEHIMAEDRRSIEWIPHNCNFRFLLSHELA